MHDTNGRHPRWLEAVKGTRWPPGISIAQR